MPDPIFERYKEALRAGHVAALRGRPDDALAQYRAAAAIAPDRALPHVGMAEVLLRLGRHADALEASETALGLAPLDEAALDLASRAHEAGGDRPAAAGLLDRLVEIRERAGRTGEALEAATRARDLDPTDLRSARVAELQVAVDAERARLTDRDHDAAAAPAPPETAHGRPGRTKVPAAAPPVASVAPPGRAPAAAAAPAGPPAGEPGPPPTSQPASTGPAETPGPAEAPVPPSSPAEPEGPSPALAAALDGAAVAPPGAGAPPAGPRPSPLSPADGAFLAAEERADRGETAEAARLYVEAATAYLAMGAPDTAVETCLRALARAPADLDVHLALARVQATTGHDDRAREAAGLLRRLLEQAGDEAGAARVSAFLGQLPAILPEQPTGTPGGTR